MAGGFGLAADAISRAISDTFKGMNEGEEERRKEEQHGIKQRQAIAEEQYLPIKFEAGRLGNQQTAQAIDLANQANKRAWSAEGRAATAFGPEQSLRESQASIAKTNAKYTEEQIQSQLETSKANLLKINEEINASQAAAPFLIPRLVNEQKKLEQEVKINQYKYDEALASRGRRDKAGAALLAAGRNRDQIARVFAEYGQDIDTNDPYVKYLGWQLELEGRLAGNNDKINPVQVLTLQNTIKARSVDDAARDAERQLMTTYGPVVVKDGIQPGLDESRAWFQQYSYARRIASSEAPNMGLVFSSADKNIPPMPDHLIDTLAKKPGWISGLFGSAQEKYVANREIYSRMNAYVTGGMEWSAAHARASADLLESRKGKATLSDPWAPKVDPKGSTSGSLLRAVPGANSVFGLTSKGATVPGNPEVQLPPRVGADEGRMSPEQIKRDRLHELTVNKWGVPWENLLEKGNEAQKEWIEEQYRLKYGTKP